MSFRLIQAKEAIKERKEDMARFIFGEALNEDGVLVEGEYCVHTQTPAFMCRLEDFDIEDDPELLPQFLKMYFTEDGEKHTEGEQKPRAYFIEDLTENETCFVSSIGLRLSSFSFFCTPVDAESLEIVLKDLIQAYLKLKQDMTEDGFFYEDQAEFSKEHIHQPSQALLIQAEDIREEDAQKLCQTLKEEAIKACLNLGESSDDLDQAIANCIETRRPDLFTSVQLALHTAEYASVRTYLLERTRALIEAQEFCTENEKETDKETHTEQSTETHTLWAMPVLQTLMHEGDCWFYPQLKVFESLIHDFFGRQVDGFKVWVSPTIFSHHVLNEHTCQPLFYLLKQLKQDRVLLLEPLEKMQEKYQKQRKKGDWRLVLSWIVFGINQPSLPQIGEEKGAIFIEKAEEFFQCFVKEQDHLSAAGELMSQVSLALPMPIWEALDVGARDYNMRRLLLIAFSFEEKNLLPQVEVDIKYNPEYGAFLLKFTAPKAKIARAMYWIAAPNLAPDVSATLDKIRHALASLGVDNYSITSSLH